MSGSTEVRITQIGHNPSADAAALLILFRHHQLDGRLKYEFPGYVGNYSEKLRHAAVRSRVRRSYTSAHGNPHPLIGFLGFIEDTPVGMATAGLNTMLPGTDLSWFQLSENKKGQKQVLNLNWLVIKKARRQGVGTKLATIITEAAITAASDKDGPYAGEQVLTTIDISNIGSQAVARVAGLVPLLGDSYQYLRKDERIIGGRKVVEKVPAQLWVPAGTTLELVPPEVT